ncbi:MAG: hypothetical protein M3Y55_04060 [Pseudomonadota bacterium]|nr:hypothetical protein [Pseudomonadota bacterium]
MSYPNDRRKNAQEGDEVLSPEYLAMLMVCGGEVRAADRTALPNANADRPYGRRAGDETESPGLRIPDKRSP